MQNDQNLKKVPPVAARPVAAPQADISIPAGWQLIKQSWIVFKSKWKAFIKPYLYILIPIVFLVLLLIAYGILSYFTQQTGGSEGVNAIVALIIGLLGLLALIAMVFFAILIPLSYLFLLKHLEKNEQVTTRALLKEATRGFWPFLLILVLSGLAIVGGLILFIIPGIIFSIWFSFAAFVFVFEGLRGVAALKRSKQLVRGYAWTILARLLVFQIFIIVLSIPSYVLQALSSYTQYLSPAMIGLTAVVSIYGIIIGFITVPLSFIYSYYIFRKLKLVKDKNIAAKLPMSLSKKVGLILAIILLFAATSIYSIIFSINDDFSVLDLQQAAVRDELRAEDKDLIFESLNKYYLENSIYPENLAGLTDLGEEYKGDPFLEIDYIYAPAIDGDNFVFCQVYETVEISEDELGALVCIDKANEAQIMPLDEEGMGDLAPTIE